jgi:hypothetical protein
MNRSVGSRYSFGFKVQGLRLLPRFIDADRFEKPQTLNLKH